MHAAPQFLYVVRHGARQDRQGDGSAVAYTTSCESGHEHDPPLSNVGLRQAHATGALVHNTLTTMITPSIAGGSVLIVSSPLRRCIQTACAIRDTLVQEGGEDCSMELSTGLYELFTEGLFPKAPSFVLSPLLASVAPVDDSAALLTCYPETKGQSQSRTLAALQHILSRCHAQRSTQWIRTVIVVGHQFTCSTIASQLIQARTYIAYQQRLHGGCDATGGEGRRKHIDWKKEGRQWLQLGTRDVEDEGCPLQLQQDATVLDFDVCNVSLFEFGNQQPSHNVPIAMHLLSYKGHLSELCEDAARGDADG